MVIRAFGYGMVCYALSRHIGGVEAYAATFIFVEVLRKVGKRQELPQLPLSGAQVLAINSRYGK